jgi:hypothetical protein
LAITTIALVKARYSPALDSTRDAALTTALAEAVDWVQRRTGRVIEEASFVEYFNGDGQRRLLLHPGHRPVLHESTKYVTVTDSGTALTVNNALGYNTTADVFIEHITQDRQCVVHYESGFSVGVQNITVTYSAGWGANQAGVVPDEIVALVNEVTWLIFQSGSWVGRSQASGSRDSVTWEKTLTPVSQAVIQALEVR